MDHKVKQQYPTHPMVPENVLELKSDNEGLRKDALRSLRIILSKGSNPPCQQVIDCGAVPRLIELLSHERDPEIQLDSAWCLTNIAAGTSAQTACVVSNGAVPRFVDLLKKSQSIDVIDQSMWALGNIAGNNVGYRDLVLSANALSHILDICRKKKFKLHLSTSRNAAWTISNFCRGTPQPDFKKFHLLSACLKNYFTVKTPMF